MRIFYDTEFIEDGTTIDLISIAMVADDGREYYAVNAEMPLERIYVDPWLRENVLPSLPIRDIHSRLLVDLDTTSTLVRPRTMIRNEVREFILATPEPQLWAWYAAYDHVVYAQLFGRMINLPEGLPMFTCDLKQEAERLGNPRVPEQEAGEHNALADARHNRTIAQFLDRMAERACHGHVGAVCELGAGPYEMGGDDA